ncbi:hypothetical protein AB4Y45_34770 [Paraburkholderia sp. EG287A]|uniref:beta barrel domain-containing protein n=1 Tax=Paraburkholderia sp. EG287A TaxID=3237012 RepID=UPI0034D340C5
MPKLEVGQTLLFESSPCANQRVRDKVVVTAVGRKWANIEGAHTGRVNVETMEVDGGSFSSQGECFVSKEDWLEKIGRRIVWDSLKSALRTVPPAGVTYAQLLDAAKLLGIPVASPNVDFE